MKSIRDTLRQVPVWVGFQTLNREGWTNVAKRLYVQRRILVTPSIETATEGPVEVRVLTWKRDWTNVLWALKTFYHYSGVDYPLYIHDGGLEEFQRQHLKDHFPNARLIAAREGDEIVTGEFERRGWTRSLAYRKKNLSTRKLFDFFTMSKADVMISIDSDVLFFANPVELVSNYQDGINLYNRDCQYGYSLSLDDLRGEFGVHVPPHINSGLSRIYCRSIDFDRIDRWLQHEGLYSNDWVTEQTLHALCSSLHGTALLPSSYLVSTEPGFPERLVAKHYPGFFRPLLYQEGMMRLLQAGFLDATYEASITTRAQKAPLSARQGS